MKVLWLKNVASAWRANWKSASWLNSSWKAQRNSQWLSSRPSKAGNLISR